MVSVLNINQHELLQKLVCFYLTHTQDLLMAEAHDVHGFHGLLEVVFVLLARDRDVTI